MKYVATSLLAFVVSIFLFPMSAIPESLLIISYIIISIQVLQRCKRTPRGFLVIAACSAAIALHLGGFKFYGKPVLADLESLQDPRRAVGVEPPNIVRFADGSSTPMPDVFVPARADFTIGLTNNYGVFVDNAGVHRALNLKVGEQQWPEIEVRVTSNTISVVALRQSMYGCGNTWFPAFFPRRLPLMEREDFRLALIEAGVAYPSAEYVAQVGAKNPIWDPLMQKLRQRFLHNLPSDNRDIEKLGLALLSDSYTSDLGVDLLLEANQTNSLSHLMTRLEKIQSQDSGQNTGRQRGSISLPEVRNLLEAKLGNRIN